MRNSIAKIDMFKLPSALNPHSLMYNNLVDCYTEASTSYQKNVYASGHYESEHEDALDVIAAKPALKKPPKYSVVMYNDDYTPMDFVVEVLMFEFKHDQDSAVQIMLDIHHQGKGVAGVYTREIAETKAAKVNAYAREEGFPLMTNIEAQ